VDQARSAGCDANGLQGRPIYRRKRDSIEAHQTIVFAALAASRWIEGKTGWSTTTTTQWTHSPERHSARAGRGNCGCSGAAGLSHNHARAATCALRRTRLV
jgi:hypothetical protein